MYTYTKMSIPGPATNHCPGNGLDHKCTMECPMAIKSFLSYSSSELTSYVTQVVIQLSNDFDNFQTQLFNRISDPNSNPGRNYSVSLCTNVLLFSPTAMDK